VVKPRKSQSVPRGAIILRAPVSLSKEQQPPQQLDSIDSQLPNIHVLSDEGAVYEDKPPAVRPEKRVYFQDKPLSHISSRTSSIAGIQAPSDDEADMAISYVQ